MLGSVKIISNNVKGLQQENKRRKIFHYFNNLPEVYVIMLKETHSTPIDERQWKTEWGEHIYFSYGSSKSRGACTFIKNNAHLDINNIITDPDGWFL